MPKPAPDEKASKAEHKKHAREVLDDPEYKQRPPGLGTHGTIPEKEWKR